jgi:hypothetical protein
MLSIEDVYHLLEAQPDVSGRSLNDIATRT